MAAIFFDLDGTIWDQHMVIPESTVTAVQQLRKNGHLTFLCTGRTRSMIFGDHFFDLGMDGIVAGCGTYFELHGEEQYRYEIGLSLQRRTIDLLRSCDLAIFLESPDTLTMDRHIRLNQYGAYVMNSVPEVVRQLEGNEDTVRCSKMTILTEGKEYQPILAELRKDYEVLEHNTSFMELIPKGFSKATGIRMVCDRMNLPHADTYALGDSVNDSDMLRYAAHGVAMGNGQTAAKEAADYVTDDIHEDGVLHAMEHFGLI